MQAVILIYFLITSLRDDAAFREEESKRSIQEIKATTRLYARVLMLLSSVLVTLIVGYAVFVHQ